MAYCIDDDIHELIDPENKNEHNSGMVLSALVYGWPLVPDSLPHQACPTSTPHPSHVAAVYPLLSSYDGGGSQQEMPPM